MRLNHSFKDVVGPNCPMNSPLEWEVSVYCVQFTVPVSYKCALREATICFVPFALKTH